MLVVVSLALAVGVGLVAAIPVLRLGEHGAVRSTLRAATEPLDDAEREARTPLEAPFAQRVLVPLLERLSQAGLRVTPKGYLDGLRRRLALAGQPQPEELQRFLAGRLLSLCAAPAVFTLGAILPLSRHVALLLSLVVAVLLLLGPEALLNRRIDKRKESIRRQLADVIDLLNIGVQAGLSFEQALSRTAVAVPGELSEEFGRLLGELRMGANRAEAFDGMVARTDVPELRSFLAALRQAEEFGISIVQILASQSVEMRTERRQRAQEKAQKAPVKMLFPLVFCILPVLFIVVVGPAAIEIYRTVIK